MKKLIAFVIALLLCFSLVACADSTAVQEALELDDDSGRYIIAVAKTEAELDDGIVITTEDASTICEIIEAPESDWINDNSKCAVSCCLLLFDGSGNETTLSYCDYGVFDDLNSTRSLTLSDSERDTVNDILNEYLTLSDTLPKP